VQIVGEGAKNTRNYRRLEEWLMDINYESYFEALKKENYTYRNVNTRKKPIPLILPGP